MVLQTLYGNPLPRGIDKSEWEIPIVFEGSIWGIYDWKHYAWCVTTSKGDADSAHRLIRKISAASRIVDGFLKNKAKELLAKGEFSLGNDCAAIRGAYIHFRELTEESIRRADPDLIEGPSGPKRTTLAREHFKALRDAEYNLLATCIFFFAFTEILLDSCFSLMDILPMTYLDFRSLDWAERFKLVLGEELLRTKTTLFERLVEIRRYYRNIPVHASPQYLFPVQGAGLIPATFDNLDEPCLTIGKGPMFDLVEARNILGILVETLSLFEESERLMYGYYYTRSGLPIHLYDPFRRELLEAKISYEQFCRSVDIRVDRYYAYINVEI